MAFQLTVTAKVGPGSTVTAQIIPNVANINIDVNKKVATILTADGQPPREYDINAVTTLTCTIAAGVNGTMVMS